MVDFKTLIHKTSVDPKLLELKFCVRNKQEERRPNDFSPVFTRITQRFRLVFEGDNTVIPEELKKHVLDALHFWHPNSMKVLVCRDAERYRGKKKYMHNWHELR